MTVWLIHFVEPVEGAKTPTGAPAVTSSTTTQLLIAGDEIKGQCLWLWDIFPVVKQDADNSLNTFIMLELWLQVAGRRRLLALTWRNALERYEPLVIYTSTDFVWNNNAATVTLASSNLTYSHCTFARGPHRSSWHLSLICPKRPTCAFASGGKKLC